MTAADAMQQRLPGTDAGGSGRPSGSVTGIDPSQAAIAYARRRAPASATFTTGVAQDLSAFPDSSVDLVTSTLALHHAPARKRETALREMYRVTRPGGRLLIADFDPSRPVLPLHPGASRMQHAAAATGPLHELAAAAGYQVQDHGTLPLLRYVLATKERRGPGRAAASTGSRSVLPPDHGVW